MLLDEDGAAAGIAGTKKMGLASFKPAAIVAGVRSTLKGKRQHKVGRRPLQLGATLVIGPRNKLLYSDYEDFAGDHADLDEVLDALRAHT